MVIGRGSQDPYVIVIGEAPGRAENAIGEPFVGPSGKFLEEALRVAMGVSIFDAQREGIYFTNIVRCRPCDSVTGPNRAPISSEVSACLPKMIALLDALRPKVIVRLGLSAQLHTSFLESDNRYKIVDLPHPAALLRRGGTKAYDYKDYVSKLRRIWKHD